MKWEEFKQQKEIKHRADLSPGDVILIDDGNGFRPEEKTFLRVVCDGHCGRDEFYGYIEETGKRFGWCKGDMYKIVGIEISETAP